MKPNLQRRDFLKGSAITAGGLALSGAFSKAFAAVCAKTPAQTSGPFYPGEAEFTADTDLTRIPGHLSSAEGQVIYVKGKVQDTACKPITNANVEIWQACASGRYNHKNDPNPAKLDPHFKYWGEAFTNAEGEYMFKTIIPGAYPADTNWIRPPHIHFKITKLGYRELVTQLYFKGNEYNEKDLILLDTPPAERPLVVVDFQPSPAGLQPDSLMGNFDITLRAVR